MAPESEVDLFYNLLTANSPVSFKSRLEKMSSCIFGAGILSTLCKLAPLESSPDKLPNPRCFPKKHTVLEQANLSDGPLFVDGEKQAEGPRTQSTSVAERAPELRLSLPQCNALINPYPCVAMCHHSPVTQSTSQLAILGCSIQLRDL